MKLSGTYRLKASRDKVWKGLNDPEVLRQCAPGCKQMTRVEDTSPDISYDVLMEVGIASIKGSYTGKLQVAEEISGSQYRLILTGNGTNGFVRAEGLIQLKDLEEETLVDYSGQVQVGGLIASVGQRVMESAAKLLVGQFFKSFEAAGLKRQAASRNGPL